MFTSFENPPAESNKPESKDISWSELLGDKDELRDSLAATDLDAHVESAIRDSGIPAEYTPLPPTSPDHRPEQTPESYDFTTN